MNSVLTDLLEAFEQLPGKMNDFGAELMASDSVNNLMAELNKDQLYQGNRSDGSDIEPDYKDMTVQIKQSKGQVVDRVTLKDTGDFYDSIHARKAVDRTELYATDYKTENLKEKYGEKILGLTEDSLEEVRESILPDFQEQAVREIKNML